MERPISFVATHIEPAKYSNIGVLVLEEDENHIAFQEKLARIGCSVLGINCLRGVDEAYGACMYLYRFAEKIFVCSFVGDVAFPVELLKRCEWIDACILFSPKEGLNEHVNNEKISRVFHTHESTHEKMKHVPVDHYHASLASREIYFENELDREISMFIEFI